MTTQMPEAALTPAEAEAVTEITATITELRRESVARSALSQRQSRRVARRREENLLAFYARETSK